MKRRDTISWFEILIIDLALVLVIGLMGASKAANSSTPQAAHAPVLVASR